MVLTDRGNSESLPGIAASSDFWREAGTRMQPTLALGGRREQRKVERREAILDVAQQSFLEHGYDGTKMSGVAEILGESKATLWSYFGSKEVLFGAMVERAANRFRADLIATLTPQSTPEAGLLCFAENFIKKISSPDAIALHRVVVGESPRFPKLGRIFYSLAPGAMLNLVGSYLAVQMDAQALRRADPMKAARMFLSLCDGGHHKRVLWGVEAYSDSKAKKDAATAVEHFIQVYGTDSK